MFLCGNYYLFVSCDTHHADVEGVEQVEGQGGDQVYEEPGGGVVDADGAGVVNHLTWGAHVRGSKVQHDIWQGDEYMLLNMLSLLGNNAIVKNQAGQAGCLQCPKHALIICVKLTLFVEKLCPDLRRMPLSGSKINDINQ